MMTETSFRDKKYGWIAYSVENEKITIVQMQYADILNASEQLDIIELAKADYELNILINCW